MLRLGLAEDGWTELELFPVPIALPGLAAAPQPWVSLCQEMPLDRTVPFDAGHAKGFGIEIS